MELKKIDINKLKPGKYQPRKEYSKEEMEELKESLRKDNKNAIVKVDKDNHVIDGHNLVSALKQLKHKVINCLVLDFDDGEKLISALKFNSIRKNLTPEEKGEALAKVQKKKNLDLNELSKLTGINITSIRECIESYKFSTRTKIKAQHTSIRATAGLKDKERIKVIKYAEKKGIPGRHLEEKIVPIIKKATEPIKTAILKDEISPEEADELMGIKDDRLQKEALASTKRHKKEAKQYRDFVKNNKQKNIAKKRLLSKDEILEEEMKTFFGDFEDCISDLSMLSTKFSAFLKALETKTLSMELEGGATAEIKIMQNLKPAFKNKIKSKICYVENIINKMLKVKEKFVEKYL